MEDVMIAGAGPVGLSLALALARAGKTVLVLEKNPSLSEHSRAPGIWPRTQEVLAGLGVIDRFLKEGIVLPEAGIWDADSGKILIRFPFRELASETRFPHMLILPQNQTERLLYEALLKQPTASVRFSAELTGFEQENSFVVARFRSRDREHECRAQYLVGCDGARSSVREVLGLSFDGITYSMQAALADIRFWKNREDPFPRLSNSGVLAIALRISPDLWRLILPFSQNSEMPLEERIRQSAPRLFPGITEEDSYDVVWKSEFRLHRRLASDFVRGRVVLAGDAAHLNSPVGGQGMNAGIQDTEILAPCLVRALDHKDPSLLRDYEKKRRRAVRQGVNAFTNQLTRALLFGEGKMIKVLFKSVDAAMRWRPFRHSFLRRLTMLD